MARLNEDRERLRGLWSSEFDLWSRASFGSTYGAAGSLIVVIVWVYYSAQIFIFGAEFTHVFAHTHGSKCPARQAATSATRR